ncbi:MAG TPA: DUF3291 domain-containing protein [Roseiarcus sp.]|nr:DUF3291 domain-containing protein [Roseiarcus sp.]
MAVLTGVPGWRDSIGALQGRSATGAIRVAVVADARQAFWTCTVWNDEKSMRAFLNSGSHRKVMPRLLDWCDEASVAHWEQESSEAPSWREARERMRRAGRRSRVRFPSAAQEGFEIPEPRTRAELRLK